MRIRAEYANRHRTRAAGLGLWLLLAGCALLLPAQASAQSSLFCPTINASVANGGSVSIDVSTCDGPFDGGVSGPFVLPVNGTVTIGPNNLGVQFVTYAHGGNGATSDLFTLEDQDNGIITVNITINPPTGSIVVAPGTLPGMTAGTAFSQTLTSTGGTAPYTYTLDSGTLPVGLSLSSGGVLSGIPTQRGGYAFNVRAQDSLGAFAIKGYTGSVADPALSIAPAAATAVQGVAFSQALAASGGVAPHDFQLESGTFPAGITISSAGVVSGTTPAAAGNYPVTLRVTDSSSGPGSYFELEAFTLTVSPPPSVSIAVAPASVSEDGATNLVYTLTRSVALSSASVVDITTGGTATAGTDYSGAVATATIPANATTTAITIDPTVDGTVEADETVTLTVAPGSGYTVGAPASATGTILNDDVPIATVSVAPASVSEDGATNLVYTVSLNQAALAPLSLNFTVGGTATAGTDYAAIVSPLAIPAGNTSGTLTVDPTADGANEADETVTVTLAAGSGYAVGAPNGATGTILNDDLPNLTINDVSQAEGNAGTTSATFTVSLGAPAGPGGVGFDIASANGTATAGSDYIANSLTGQTIPAGSSTYTFTVLVNGDTANEPGETYLVNVTNVTNAVVADGQGLGTITNDDPLPSLSINNASVAEGNAGTALASFTVTLSAASGQAVAVNYATADGSATAPADYTATSGTLNFAPGELTKTISVTVNGDIVPEASETFTVNLSAATNATILVASGTGTITNDDVPVTISPLTLPATAVTAAYSQTLSASGGVAPYTFAVSAGALPAGLTLSGAGVLGGTPTAGGSFNFTVTATDSSAAPGPFSGSQPYTLVVNAPTVVLPPTTLATANVGLPYTAPLNAASGGTAPYGYAVTAGALPGGMTLGAGGTITGTPTAAGTFNFGVTATDSSTGTGPYTATQNYSLVSIAIDIAPATLAGGSAGTAYAQTLSASGGAAPYGYAVTAGALPAGMNLGANGALGGTPTASGTFNFTVTATDANLLTGSRAYTLTIGVPTLVLAPAAVPGGTAGTPYSQALSASGGVAPYSYAVTAGALPAGLALSPTGVLAGTPTVAGPFNFTVTATDSTGGTPGTVSGTYSLAIAAPTIAIAPAALPNAVIGTPFNVALAANGGAAPYTYAVTAGAPPTGLTLSPAGVLSGVPNGLGVYTFTVRATDANGFTGTIVYNQNGVAAVIPVPAIGPAGLALLVLVLSLLGALALRRRIVPA